MKNVKQHLKLLFTEELSKCLNEARADNYQSWIAVVGLCIILIMDYYLNGSHLKRRVKSLKKVYEREWDICD